MFTVKKIKAPVHIYFITQYPFPAGISKAWLELESYISERAGIKFYGVFDGQQYLAGCDSPNKLSVSRESLQEYIIPAGTYLAHTIHNWQDKKELIALTFQRMEEEPGCDKDSEDIEFYRSNTELVCLKSMK
ncbi:MAG: hypothetical protein HLUCCX10_15325 [Algoriphagus marincola HL-49]|uniref:GyrI-like small molecule binding domain-containing protein n=1 Tax=Algoriphagus marincola HL-49 TaxID=1305737 RepID=A0A0N8KEG7_9BACT|nr:MAG: hypothetical protein HLUCCX10_15325 [Algoriphagus marincola HL-49]